MIVSSKKRQESVTGQALDGYARLAPCNIVQEAAALASDGDVAHLQFTIKRALEKCSPPDEVVSLRKHLQGRSSLPNVVSKNPRMSVIFDLIKRLAHTTTTVLIEGETGTGKEHVAQAVHQASRARPGPLVAVTCAALPESLLESELFGHEKGAFTSAVGQHKGRFELAQGGTLFLDEVGDIPASMQAKLLRVLQERRFERVGGSQSIAVDVRVVAATNRCLRKMVRDGTFREDLYYRLNVVKIDVPPLRERPEDIPSLAIHFTEKHPGANNAPKRLSPACMELLLRYHWPGNIRELENAIERACVASRDNLIQPEDLPSEVVLPPKGKLQGPIDWSQPLAEVLAIQMARLERHYLRRALKRSQGSIDRCAKLCGISRRNLSSKLAKYQIDKSEFKNGERRGPSGNGSVARVPGKGTSTTISSRSLSLPCPSEPERQQERDSRSIIREF